MPKRTGTNRRTATDVDDAMSMMAARIVMEDYGLHLPPDDLDEERRRDKRSGSLWMERAEILFEGVMRAMAWKREHEVSNSEYREDPETDTIVDGGEPMAPQQRKIQILGEAIMDRRCRVSKAGIDRQNFSTAFGPK